MIPNVNEGDRPSRLELGRYAAGELDAEERARLEARLDDRSRAWLADVEAARARVPPLDLAALRRRAGPAPANTTRWYGLGAVALALAALVLALVLVGRPDPGPDVRLRSGDALTVHHLAGGALVDYAPGTALGEGDVLGFKVGAAGHRSVVLLSVDGEGRVDVSWPERGDAPEPLSGDGLVALPGTLVLDDAPGPEVFVAVFDADVPTARAGLERAWAEGGAVGVLDWAADAEGVDAVEVTRR